MEENPLFNKLMASFDELKEVKEMREKTITKFIKLIKLNKFNKTAEGAVLLEGWGKLYNEAIRMLGANFADYLFWYLDSKKDKPRTDKQHAKSLKPRKSLSKNKVRNRPRNTVDNVKKNRRRNKPHLRIL